jgi:hypothetical protein
MSDPTLLDGQWHLAYDAYKNLPGASRVFGRVDDGVFLTQDVDVLYGDALLGDSNPPMQDGLRFGPDFASGTTLNFSLGLDTSQLPDKFNANGALVSGFRSCWDAAAVRRQSNTVTTLRYRLGSRVRRVYGRPRQFAPSNTAFAKQGYTSGVAAFQMLDQRFYDDIEQQVWINKIPTDARGFVVPFTTPLTTIRSTTQEGALVVGGDATTWPVATIFGPIAQPVVEVVGVFKIGLNLTIPAGAAVVVDPRPWVRTAMNGSTNVAGALTAVTPRMDDMALPPGSYATKLSGQDLTGTSRALFAWRNAWSYL